MIEIRNNARRISAMTSDANTTSSATIASLPGWACATVIGIVAIVSILAILLQVFI
jgi:hypothetical protein